MKLAEKKLEESEEKYHKLFNNVRFAIILFNIEGTILDCNDATKLITGYSKEELIGNNFRDFNFYVDPSSANLEERQSQTYSGKPPKEREILLYRKDGSHFWARSQIEFIQMRDGKYIQAIIHDITEKKKSEHMLKESEKKYRSLFNNMNAGFAYHEVIVDENNKPIDYKYIEVNPAFEKLTGLKARDMIGKKVTEILPGTEDDPADWIGKFGNVGLTGTPLTVEDYSEAIDRWYKVSGYSPKKGYFAVTFTDITEQKKIEQKLKESEEKYRKLFENSPIALMEQDYSETKSYIDNLTSSGITDFEKYFDENPKEVLKLMTKNKVVDVNRKTAEVYKANNKEDLLLKMNNLGNNIDKKITDEVFLYNKQEFLSFIKGETIYESEIVSKTFTEEKIYLYARTSIMPGFESTWSKVIVSIIDITEEKLIEKKLMESEKKFRTIFEAIPDLFFLVSEDTSILDYRGKEQELYLSPEDFLNKKIIDLLPSLVGTKTLKLVKKTIETKESQILEYDLELRGKTHFFEARYFYFSENQVSIFIRDITERKKAEKQIIDVAKFPSENPNPVLRINRENILYINQAGRDLLNVSEGDMIPAFLRDGIIKALGENISRRIEVKVNGAIFSFNIAPIKQEDYANIYGQDITERKKSEMALSIEKKFSEDIIYSSQDTIFVFDPEIGKALRWNKEFNEVTGYSNEEISLMKAPDSYYSEKDLKIAKEAIQNLIEEGKTTLEMSLITKDGRKIPYEYKATTLEEPGGKISIVSIGRDMTERKLAEQKLKESEQKYRNAYDMANFYKDLFTHDMSNLLQIINSSAEIISFQLGDSEKSIFIENMANMIKSQVERGSKLISDVRTLTSLAEEEIATEKIEIARFLESSIKFVKKAYSERKVSIIPDMFEKEYLTNANELLQDVFENILINGIKYNESEIIEILINISKQKVENKDYIEIEFIDNGIGVSDSKKELIFQPDNREIKGTKGMGIGLSLVSKILEIFKGKIWVEDKIKGDYSQGSKFIVLLPDLN